MVINALTSLTSCGAIIFSELRGLFSSELREIFSELKEPQSHKSISLNLARVSSWNTFSSAGVALVSFLFSRFLIQKEPWKTFAPYVIKASLISFGIFGVVASYSLYKLHCGGNCKALNERVSLFAKGSAGIGLIGAAAAWAAKCVISNTLVRSLAERLLFPLLGLGVAGSILGIFLNWQNKQIKNPDNEFF